MSNFTGNNFTGSNITGCTFTWQEELAPARAEALETGKLLLSFFWAPG